MNNEMHAQFEKTYPGGPAIHCDLHKPARESHVTVLFGPSGCGKTTTLRCLAGLDPAKLWSHQVPGFNLVRREPWRYAPTPGAWRRFPVPGLRPVPTSNCVRQYRLWARPAIPAQEIKARVDEMMALLQIDGLGNRLPRQLSGGQQQRVAAGPNSRGSPQPPSPGRTTVRARSTDTRRDSPRASSIARQFAYPGRTGDARPRGSHGPGGRGSRSRSGEDSAAGAHRRGLRQTGRSRHRIHSRCRECPGWQHRQRRCGPGSCGGRHIASNRCCSETTWRIMCRSAFAAKM